MHYAEICLYLRLSGLFTQPKIIIARLKANWSIQEQRYLAVKIVAVKISIKP
jgi:hypothetical protein